MSKLAKEKTLFCSIYDVTFRNVANELEVAVEKELCRKMDFVLTDLLLNVQRDCLQDHSQYDVFGPKDIKYMAKVLEDVIKLKRAGNLICPVLQYTLWYNA